MGTAIGYVIMFAVLALVAFLLFSPGVGMNTQFANLIENVPVYVQGISDWANDMYARYAYMLEDESVRAFVTDVQASAMDWAGDFAKNSASGAIAFGTGLANAFMAIGFALVVAFWILMQLPQLGRECKRLVGGAHAEDLEMLHITFTRVMGGYIKGTLLQCAIIGVACGILFAVLGIPNSMALGGITGILNIIPIIGPWLGGGLAAIVGIFVSPLVAVIAILGTIVDPAVRLHVHLAEDHVRLSRHPPGAHAHRPHGGLGARRCDGRTSRLACGHAGIYSRCCRREIRFRVLFREANGLTPRLEGRRVLLGHSLVERRRRRHRILSPMLRPRTPTDRRNSSAPRRNAPKMPRTGAKSGSACAERKKRNSGASRC